MSENTVLPFSYCQEVARKLIHLSSLWMPAALYFLDRTVALSCFGAALTLVLLFELLRRQANSFGRWLGRAFGAVLREKEAHHQKQLTGAVYVLLAGLLVGGFFPQPIAILALVIMLIGDAAAALFGRRYGKTPLLGKSLEGSAAFLATSSISVLALLPLLEPQGHFVLAGLGACVVATLVELCSRYIPLDDNLTVTLAAALAFLALT